MTDATTKSVKLRPAGKTPKSERYGYTAVVGIWADNEFVAIRTFKPARSLSVAEHTGFHSPAYATAQGRVFLAFLPEDELDHYLRTTELRALTPETLTNQKSLRVELATIREHLYAVASRGRCWLRFL